MLRLVHPARAGQEKSTSKKKQPALTDFEQARFRAALRNLRGVFGTWERLAEAMGTTRHNLKASVSGRHGISGDLVLRAAKAAKKPVEALLQEITDAGVCPSCGRGAK